MKLKDRLRQVNKKEADELAQNAAAVEAANSRMLLLVLMIGIATFGALWLLTYIVAGFDIFRMPDIILVFSFLGLFGLSRLRGLHVPANVWLYGTFAVYTVVTILSGVLVTPDYVDVMIFVCLFQLPVLMLDNSWRVDLIVVILAAAYMIVVVPNKVQGLAKNEITNVFFFTAAALASGGFLRRARLDNFELERQSALRETTDYLTGLYNRRKLFDYFNEEEHRDAEPITGMLMLDIDNFKLYNDTYGHIAGDDCLRRIAECMRGLSEKNPIQFFRYGGEEFLGTSCLLTREQLRALCEELAEEVRSLNIVHDAVEQGRVTVSIGVTKLRDGGIQYGKYEQMLTEADSALYEAKRRGRDRVILYEPRMTEMEKRSFHP